jgi:hypothetical protein
VDCALVCVDDDIIPLDEVVDIMALDVIPLEEVVDIMALVDIALEVDIMPLEDIVVVTIVCAMG